MGNTHYINVGTFAVGEEVYPDRCLSASLEGPGIEAEEIPWGDRAPWDYRYDGEGFVFEPIPLPEPEPPTPSPEERIAELEAALAALLSGEVGA